MNAAASTSTAYEARFWDRIARKYASDLIKGTDGYERTRELLTHTDTVLEIGCGTGTTALKLAPSVQRIVGTDISGEMITIARERAAVAAWGNAEFEAAPAQRIAGADRPFDTVLAFNLLHLVADRPNTLREDAGRLAHLQDALPCRDEPTDTARRAGHVGDRQGALRIVLLWSPARAGDRQHGLCHHRAGAARVRAQGCPGIHRGA